MKMMMAGVLLGVLAWTEVEARGAAPERPNVVFILADDLGWNDTSVGATNTFLQTPNLEKLAARGMRFTRACSASPLCSPTRASLLTGQHPARLGITAPECHVPEVRLEKGLAVKAPPHQRMLPAASVTRLGTNAPTLADAFRRAGYATGHFGKWHLGAEPYSPLEHGFEVDVPHTSAPSPLPNGFFHPFPVWKGHGKPGDHLEDLVCDEAVTFIETHKDRPFFLNYWAFEVHSPWQAKPGQIDKYRARMRADDVHRNPVYAGMVETLDEVVGRLVAALERAGVRERTLIIFTSDNGPYFQPNAEHMPGEFHQVPVSSAWPLRAGKGTVYEGGTRVPLIVSWPGRIREGTVSDAWFQSTDWFPTLTELCGLPPEPAARWDGVSQAPVLAGGAPVRNEVFCHFPHASQPGTYERMAGPTPGAPASYLVRDGWKLIRFYGDGPEGTDRHELYDLEQDPGERTDRSDEHPDRVRKLSAALDDALKATGAVIPVPNPAYRLSGSRGSADPGKGPPGQK